MPLPNSKILWRKPIMLFRYFSPGGGKDMLTSKWLENTGFAPYLCHMPTNLLKNGQTENV
jgi:hypothetical protein